MYAFEHPKKWAFSDANMDVYLHNLTESLDWNSFHTAGNIVDNIGYIVLLVDTNSVNYY